MSFSGTDTGSVRLDGEDILSTLKDRIRTSNQPSDRLTQLDLHIRIFSLVTVCSIALKVVVTQ